MYKKFSLALVMCAAVVMCLTHASTVLSQAKKAKTSTTKAVKAQGVQVETVKEAKVAKPKNKKSDKQIREEERPTQEDYYSVSQRELSDADLKKADALAVKTIGSIQELLGDKRIPASRKFELRLRMGELYAERHDYLRDNELNSFERRYDAWLAKGAKGKAPVISHKASKNQLANAANTFRNLVREFPKNPRTPAALYALGKTLSRLEDDNSIIYFKQLIKDHPNSNLIPDAHLAMGEFYFEKHNMSEATKSYQAVLRYKEHKAYVYAVYKLGWCFYNSTPDSEEEAKKLVDKSITSFKLVIRLSDRDKGKAGRIDLRKEAIKDLIVVWSETEDTQSAWTYFQTIGEKDSFYTLLERLGAIYTDQGKNDKAVEVYSRLLREVPTKEGNPKTHEQLVGLYDILNRPDLVVKTLRTMVALYVQEKGTWFRGNATNKEALAEATKLVEFNLHKYGTLYHQRGQKAKSNPLLKTSSEIYLTYLNTYENNPNAYTIRYYLADILLEFKAYEQASMHYSIVAKADPKGKYRKNAAFNAVMTLNTADGEKKYPKLPPAGQVKQPIEIPQLKKKLVVAVDNFVTYLPKDKDGHPMRYTAAQVYFDYGHYDEAVRRFNKIIDEIPNTKQGETSAKVMLAFHIEKQNWSQLIPLSRKFLANKNLVKGKMKDHINDVLKNAMYQQALTFDKAKKYQDAAKSFIAFQKEFPKDLNADRALFNASLNYYKAGSVEEALAVDRILIDSYPKSAMKSSVLVNMAQTYESIVQFERAAEIYEKFASEYLNDKRASASLYNAAVLYKGLKKYSKSESLFNRFAKFYPKNTLANQAVLEIAMLQEKQNKFKEAVASYKNYAELIASTDKDNSMYSEAKAASINFNKVDASDGRKQLMRLRTLFGRKGSPNAYEGRRIVAEEMFKMSEPQFKGFMAMTVTDPKKVEAQVKTKQARLVSVAAEYQSIITVGSPEYVVASLYKLGEMHENFANILINMPSPKDMSPVEVQSFRSSIEKVAFPLRDEGIKFYETAYKRSQEVDTFTVWTKRSYEKMSEISPDKYPEIIEQSAEPLYLSHKIDVDDTLAKLSN